MLSMTLKWAITQLFIYYSRVNYWVLGVPCKLQRGECIAHFQPLFFNRFVISFIVCANQNLVDDFHEDDEDDPDPEYDDREHQSKQDKGDDSNKKVNINMDEEDEYFNRKIVPIYETHYEPCDKKSDLFLLQQERFLKGKPPPSKGQSVSSRYCLVLSIYSFISQT